MVHIVTLAGGRGVRGLRAPVGRVVAELGREVMGFARA